MLQHFPSPRLVAGRTTGRAVRLAVGFALIGALLPLAAASAVGVNLGFTTSPPNPATGSMGFPVTVHVQDNAAAALPGVLVTLDIDPAHNPGADVLTCTNGTAINSNGSGNAAFNGCRITRLGSGYALRARASGATTVISTTFDVQAGAAAAFEFASYPANPTPPGLTPQPVVRIVDAAGNVVTGDHRVVSLGINKHAGTFSCSGGLSTAAVSGVATFSGCQETAPDNGYRLTVNDGGGGLPAKTGAAFTITSGPSASLRFCWGNAGACRTTPPSPITGGVAFSLQPSIRVVDAAGNTITTDNSTVVTLSILAGTPTAGGPGLLTCTGGLARTVSQGVATFAGCSIDRAGTGYRLLALASSGIASAQSLAFDVTGGGPAKLVFLTQPPTTATAGVPFGSAVQVGIADAAGRVVTTGITATIKLAIGKNPGGATLGCSGGNMAATAGGIATFPACVMSAAGNGYTLVATSVSTVPATTLTSATSSAFNVLAVIGELSLTTSPPSGVITWGATVILNVHFSSNGAGRTFVLQVSKDKATWSPIATLTTNGSGNAAFGYRPSDNRYYRAVFAGAPDLAAASSPTARVVVRQINLLRPTNGGHVVAVAHGTTITFTSTVRPNRPELPQAHVNFVVYRLVGSQWVLVLNQTTGVSSDGVATLHYTFSVRGQFYVRSQAVPTTFNANSGWSPVERYNVT